MRQWKQDAPELNFELYGKGCESCKNLKISENKPFPSWGEVLRILLDALLVAQSADFKHKIITQC